MYQIITVDQLAYHMEGPRTEDLYDRARREGLMIGDKGRECQRVEALTESQTAYTDRLTTMIQMGRTIWLHPMSILAIF